MEFNSGFKGLNARSDTDNAVGYTQMNLIYGDRYPVTDLEIVPAPSAKYSVYTYT